jgi:DNA modification methylase
MSTLKVEYLPPECLRADPKNARTHDKRQTDLAVKTIRRIGFRAPVLVSEDLEIDAGHLRVTAALRLGLKSIPVIRLTGMTPAERRAFRLADNRLAELAGWDREILAGELLALEDLKFDEPEVTGFTLAQIDDLLDEANEKSVDAPGPEDDIPPVRSGGGAVSRPGDVWTANSHRIACGDALTEAAYEGVLAGQKADLVLTDPPYNVPIERNVSGLGHIRHQDFMMASGEMSEAEFTTFLSSSLGRAKACLKEGAILFVFMDWRHLYELITACRDVDLAFKNLIVWVKTNAGMGTFYRSRHELILVLKNGDSPHVNTFELGQHGRTRTNVWEYPGVNTFREGRMEELSMHPTVKPTALVADAIRDVTRRGDIVLDPFAGSGTTLIAAEKTGRRACVIELDPRYCDVIVRRWQNYTGKAARLEGSGLTFEDVETERGAPQDAGKGHSGEQG